ncbi:hypothetical protein VPH35_047303 [Triticum aestivum]
MSSRQMSSDQVLSMVVEQAIYAITVDVMYSLFGPFGDGQPCVAADVRFRSAHAAVHMWNATPDVLPARTSPPTCTTMPDAFMAGDTSALAHSTVLDPSINIPMAASTSTPPHVQDTSHKSSPDSNSCVLVTGTSEYTLVAANPEVVTKLAEIPNVAHDATPVCIPMVPVTCSTECSTQVDAIDSVDEAHDVATVAVEVHNTSTALDVSELFKHVKQMGVLSTEISRNLGLQLRLFEPLLSSAPATITVHYLISMVPTDTTVLIAWPLSFKRKTSASRSCLMPWPSFACSLDGVTLKHTWMLPQVIYVMKSLPGNLNSLKAFSRYFPNLQLKSRFTVQVCSELPKVEYFEHQFMGVCEDHVVVWDYAFLGCIPISDKLQGIVHLMHMSVRWIFLSQEEFKGSGRVSIDFHTNNAWERCSNLLGNCIRIPLVQLSCSWFLKRGKKDSDFSNHDKLLHNKQQLGALSTTIQSSVCL